MKNVTLECGKLNASKGCNVVDWTHTREMTQEDLNDLIEYVKANEVTKNHWSYTNKITEEIINFRIVE